MPNKSLDKKRAINAVGRSPWSPLRGQRDPTSCGHYLLGKTDDSLSMDLFFSTPAFLGVMFTSGAVREFDIERVVKNLSLRN